MYVLNIMTKIGEERTEQEHYAAGMKAVLGKIKAVCDEMVANPKDELVDFKINRLKGSVPTDVKLLEDQGF